MTTNKAKFTDVQTLVVKFPVEIGTDVSWNGKYYELFAYETEELKKEWPGVYNEDNDEIVLVIDVETGHINNFPPGVEAEFYTIKVVDSGTYTLIGKDGQIVAAYEGYVPDCLAVEDDGYGDYFEFGVKDSTIMYWKWTEKLFKEFLSNCPARSKDDE